MQHQHTLIMFWMRVFSLFFFWKVTHTCFFSMYGCKSIILCWFMSLKIEGQMLQLRVRCRAPCLHRLQWMCNGTLLNDARTTQWLSLQANVWHCRTDLATSSNQWVSFSTHIFIRLNMSVHVKTKVVQRGHHVLCMFLCLQRPGLLHLALICKPWEWASQSVRLRLHLVLTCPRSSPPESTKGQ